MNSDGLIHNGTDMFPFSINKIAMLRACLLPEGIETYLFPLVKYHGNWKTVGHSQWNESRKIPRSDVFNGFRLTVRKDVSDKKLMDLSKCVPGPVCAKNIDWLMRINKIARDNDCHVLMITAPKPEGDRQVLNGHLTIYDVAKKSNINVINFNELSLVDVRNDFNDKVHLNTYGAEKASRYLAEYIAERYRIKPTLPEAEQASWLSMVKRYELEKDKLMKDVCN